jgi:hypothetical protein
MGQKQRTCPRFRVTLAGTLRLDINNIVIAEVKAKHAQQDLPDGQSRATERDERLEFVLAFRDWPIEEVRRN